jgi:hypothetical protein
MSKSNTELYEDLLHATVTNKLGWYKMKSSKGKSLYMCKTGSHHTIFFKYFDLQLQTTHQTTDSGLLDMVIDATRSADIDSLDIMFEKYEKKSQYCTVYEVREFLRHVLENIGEQLIRIQIQEEKSRIVLRDELMQGLDL